MSFKCTNWFRFPVSLVVPPEFLVATNYSVHDAMAELKSNVIKEHCCCGLVGSVDSWYIALIFPTNLSSVAIVYCSFNPTIPLWGPLSQPFEEGRRNGKWEIIGILHVLPINLTVFASINTGTSIHNLMCMTNSQ